MDIKINLEKGEISQISTKGERGIIIKRRTKQEFKLPADATVEAVWTREGRDRLLNI